MKLKAPLALALSLSALLALAPSACSSDDSKAAPAKWICCVGLFQACHCFEIDQNSVGGCSDEVASCGDVDGGIGCCVEGTDNGDHVCDCSAPGEACPTLSSGAGTQVAKCPP